MALNREFYANCFARSALGARDVAQPTNRPFAAAAKKEFDLTGFLKDLAAVRTSSMSRGIDREGGFRREGINHFVVYARQGGVRTLARDGRSGRAIRWVDRSRAPGKSVGRMACTRLDLSI